MRSIVSFSFLVFVTCSVAADWPCWRGPNHDGHAPDGSLPPLNASDSIVWSTPLPGRAHGSPIVFGDLVVLNAADEQEKTQSVLAFDRRTGSRAWEVVVHEGGFHQEPNKKASWASSTPACDGERIFATFVNGDAAYLHALGLDGSRQWTREISPYVIHQGYGASPFLHRHLVIVAADNKGGGAIVAYDRTSGEEAWRIARPEMPNYPSPVVLEVAGSEQLILTGTEKVSSFDPLTGKTNWEIEGATTECVTTSPTDGTHVYSSGGYPKNHVAAIKADGSGEIAWETNDRVYVPSMLIREGYLYAVSDAGIALCWDAATGEEKWKARVGGTFSSSPVLAGDRIYCVNEAGEMTVFQAAPDGYEELAKAKIADEVFATPAIVDGRIYLRVADYEGEARKERLVCLGE